MNIPTFPLHSPSSYEALLQHWAKARIDTPLHIIGRFDDAAKNLITLGGLMQGLLIATGAFGQLQQRVAGAALLLVVVFLVAGMVCAARVLCVSSKGLEAMGAYDLFKVIAQDGAEEREIFTSLHDWCVRVEDLKQSKHRWLIAANILFVITFSLTLYLVYEGMR